MRAGGPHPGGGQPRPVAAGPGLRPRPWCWTHGRVVGAGVGAARGGRPAEPGVKASGASSWWDAGPALLAAARCCWCRGCWRSGRPGCAGRWPGAWRRRCRRPSCRWLPCWPPRRGRSPWGWRCGGCRGRVVAGPRRAGSGSPSRRRRPPTAPTAAIGRGLVLAGCRRGRRWSLASLARGIGWPGALSQTYDAVFHLNAVRWVLDHQDGSSLHLAAAGRGSGEPGLLPGRRGTTSSPWWRAGPGRPPPWTCRPRPTSRRRPPRRCAWPLGCAALAHVTPRVALAVARRPSPACSAPA